MVRDIVCVCVRVFFAVCGANGGMETVCEGKKREKMWLLGMEDFVCM